MKVAINIQADIQEIEVIINCMAEDENVQRIVSALDSLNTKLCCRRQGELFQIALNDILYIESVDRKTFIYTEQQIYETDKRLYELENHLKNRSFFRASKAVIINLKRTKSIRPEIGARLLLTMDNGEKVIVSRQYSSVPREEADLQFLQWQRALFPRKKPNCPKRNIRNPWKSTNIQVFLMKLQTRLPRRQVWKSELLFPDIHKEVEALILTTEYLQADWVQKLHA